MASHQVPFIVLRTALESLATFAAWADLPETLPYREKVEALRARLHRLVERPAIREALWLASPDLLDAVRHGPGAPDSASAGRRERALVRYCSRLCGRATPFGLFAGTTLGSLGARTCFKLGPASSYRRRSRLDMAYLQALARRLAKDPAVQAELVFRPNPDLYELAGALRYAEGGFQGAVPTYRLVSLEESPHLLAALRRAETGAELGAIAQALVREDVSQEEALDFVLRLAEAQILVADLPPPITGPEPIHHLLGQCRAMTATAAVAASLEEVAGALARHDAEPLGGPAPYEALAARMRSLLPEAERKQLFQVDLSKPAPQAILGEDIVARVRIAMERLRCLFGGRSSAALGPFLEAFVRRYDTREVPLVQVLDPETGLGFPAGPLAPGPGEPLLEGLAFSPQGEGPDPAWLPLHAFLLEKIQASLAEGRGPIDLDPDQLRPYLLPDPLPLPDAFSVMIRLAEHGQGVFEPVLSSGAWGPSGACLLGRFCHGDPELTRAVRAHLAQEEALRPEAVFAEVVHLPNDRSGNVLLRPLLRRYEIPFLGRSGAPPDRQLPLHDLFVSVREERIVLRSARLGREVLPRLTSAQNFDLLTLPTYRFLCSLQYHGVCNPGWDWGALAGSPFLPRVLLGGVVVAPATWNLKRSSLSEVLGLQGEARAIACRAWARNHHLPRWVLLADGDQKLPVDLGNILSAETLLDRVRHRDGFCLEELYPGPSAQGVQGPEGGFVHEIVLPFLAPPRAKPLPEPAPLQVSPSCPRVFPPGSEWLYAKLYTGEAAADLVLKELVGPMAEACMGDGSVDRWWFIRYGDPDWHLRVRFHGDPEALAGSVLPGLHRRLRPFLERNLVWKVQLDTYVRELERYGQEGAIEAAERLFHADSEAALGLLRTCPGDSGAQDRWRLALMSMDALLGDLGFTLADKAALLERLRAAHGQLFPGRAGASQVGDRFRKLQPGLRLLLEPQAPPGPLAAGRALLRARSWELKPLLETFALQPGPIRQDRAASFLHMSANRLLRSAHRAQEAVLYDFLNRLYRTERAKEGLRQEPPGTLGAVTHHEH